MPERQEDLDETISGPPVSARVQRRRRADARGARLREEAGRRLRVARAREDRQGRVPRRAQARRAARARSTRCRSCSAALLRDLAFPKQMHWDAHARGRQGRAGIRPPDPLAAVSLRRPRRAVHDRPHAERRRAAGAGRDDPAPSPTAIASSRRAAAPAARSRCETFDEYRAKLPEHFVILDHAERRDRIARELEAQARKLGGRVAARAITPRSSTRSPTSSSIPASSPASSSAEFLELPHEVLTTTLVHHQHYFPVVDETGELKEAFLAVVNTQPSDERVIAKNAERVVTARLRDARFFWDADRKTTLEDRLDRLHTDRVPQEAGATATATRPSGSRNWPRTIATECFGAADARRSRGDGGAAGEGRSRHRHGVRVPGTAGRRWAASTRARRGSPKPVWKAIYYHYLPQGVEADAPPTRAQLGAAAVDVGGGLARRQADTLVVAVQRRREADRLARSVRAAPPGARRCRRCWSTCRS